MSLAIYAIINERFTTDSMNYYLQTNTSFDDHGGVCNCFGHFVKRL